MNNNLAHKFRIKRSKKAGLLPGTIVHVGEPNQNPIKINIFQYNAEKFSEISNLDSLPEDLDLNSELITWIEVNGIHDPKLIESIGNKFSLHPLVSEDIANSTQRSKIEDYENYIFVVLKMIHFDESTNRIKTEQVSLVIGDTFVLMFQENNKDSLDKVRENIRQSKGKVRKNKADYLAYSIIDAIVDNYFVFLEAMGEELELIEHELVSQPNRATLNRIYSAKRSMMTLRRAGWPLRELTGSLARSDSELINHHTKIYLRDVYDHAVEIIDIIENLRDISSGMIDVYLSSMSHKLNEVMKVLTIFATIFMPLTFISSIYGMNFDYMPELHWQYGYPMILSVMFTAVVGMLYYFRRKDWI
jgi:magnesium transporter